MLSDSENYIDSRRRTAAGLTDECPAADPFSDRILRLWSLPFLNRAGLLLAVQAVVVCACGLRAWIGLHGMRIWVHDAFVLLDGAWRVRNGQIPCNDFFTDIGPAMHVLNAFGLMLASDMPRGLGYAQAIVGLVVGVWTLALSRRRLSGAGCGILTLLLVLLALGPFDVGNPPSMTSPAMVYNRYGFAFTALGILEAVCAARPATRRSEFLGGMSTGVIAILLLFIKVSYFLGLGLVLLFLFGCRRQTLWRWTGLLAGAWAALIPFLVWMRGTLVPLLTDLRMLAGAKHVLREWFVVEAVYTSAAPFLIFAFLASALLWRCGALREARRILTLGIAVATLGICFVLANFPGIRLPLSAAAAVIVIDRVEAWFSASPRKETLLRCAILLWGSMFIFTSLFLDAGGLAFGLLAARSVGSVPGSAFREPSLAGFSSFDVNYVRFVDDGLALARQYRRPRETIMSLDYSNPFSYALRIRPAWGGTPMGLQLRTNFDDANHVEPERLLGHASLLMIPQPEMFSDYTLSTSIPRIYGPWVQRHFHLIGQTAFWRAYRNNSAD